MNQSDKTTQIVVIDDDLDVLDMVSAYFKPKGFKVISFSDGESAIKESLKSGHEWDVLLTDLRFPKMAGVEFTVQIKKNLPQLPIILITTSKATDAAEQAIKKGAYDFIVRPINFPQLRVSIERALHLTDLHENISDLQKIVKQEKLRSTTIIGRSPLFLSALDIARRVATSTASIFITGESGTGKEVFAKFIHSESKQCKGPFVAINCSAIPESLLESELFGHVKGAFTGAQYSKIGLFEEAQHGTLFLDEIGDLSLALQAKLLRVLQEKKIKRVGENTYRSVNCRILSATHKDLGKEVEVNRFREDLYFRLNVIPISIPPLRERPEDLFLLAESFLIKFSLLNGTSKKSFSKEALKFLLENPWRGNVRELENTVERAVVLCDKAEISLSDFLPFSSGLRQEGPKREPNTFSISFTDHLPSVDEVISKYIEFAVANKGGARDKTAKEIGIDRKTLYRRLKLDIHSESPAEIGI